MRFWLALLVCSTCLVAQDDDPEVARAKAGIEKLRALVAAGAAHRRLARRQKAYDEALKLVEAGVASQLSLTNFLEEKDLARKECDLAESRARLIAQLAEMAKAEEALASKAAQESTEE